MCGEAGRLKAPADPHVDAGLVVTAPRGHRRLGESGLLTCPTMPTATWKITKLYRPLETASRTSGDVAEENATIDQLIDALRADSDYIDDYPLTQESARQGALLDDLVRVNDAMRSTRPEASGDVGGGEGRHLVCRGLGGRSPFFC